MADRSFTPKEEWPDGVERVCDGSIIVFGQSRYGKNAMHVAETPKEVRTIMTVVPDDSLMELHHHADHEVQVYVDPTKIIAIDARFRRVEEN